tara:strand:- start:1137 stop:1922 length:786 start_codon:yes stop_codon:yes gene_type:complete
LRIATCLFALLVLGCVHGPTPKETEEAKALYSGAKALIAQKEYREALKDLQKAVKLNPKAPQVHYLLGIAYFTGFGRTEQAEFHLRQVLELEKDQELLPQAENLLAAVLIEAGRPEEALPHLEKARKNLLYRTPHYAEKNLGLAHFRLGNHEKAIAHFTQALKQDPNLCGAYPQLAEVYENTGELGKSITTLERFFNHCQQKELKGFIPNSLFARALYRLGMYRLKVGDNQSALKVFSQCMEEYPGETVADECAKSLKLLQ